MAIPVELRDVEKHFGTECALKNISLTLEEGRFYTLLGNNGAGKSTLMKVIARYEPMDNGYGFIFGQPMDDDQKAMGEQVAYVSEIVEYALPAAVQDFASCFRSLSNHWDESLLRSIFNECEIDPRKQFKELSRGQKIQVAFALAISRRPKILLLDEVTSVLDANVRSIVMDHLGRFVRGGGTILIATNIITELRHYPDHLFLLHRGELKVNLPMVHLCQIYCKLRKGAHEHSKVFQDPKCREVSVNTDGSVSFLLPRESLQHHRVSDHFLDRRGVTAEDLFLYFTRMKGK